MRGFTITYIIIKPKKLHVCIKWKVTMSKTEKERENVGDVKLPEVCTFREGQPDWVDRHAQTVLF